MRKVALVSLGCSKNLVDSENILGLLHYDKFQIVSNPHEADVIVINTCGFITPSKQESIDMILNMSTLNKKLVVTGCLVERYVDQLKDLIPEVDLFIPISEYYRFNELLSSLFDDLPDNGGLRDELRIVSTGNFSAYLKIGEGCDNCCSYCAIPLIRGGFKSRPIENIIKEANVLKDHGFKEIIVLEQDTTKYGVDLKNGENIVLLLEKLLEIKEFDYIRLLYLYPDEITDELIDLIAREPRLTPYFDIPIQHSESHILKAMNRRGDKDFLTNLFAKIKSKVPNAILRTTLLVGFPGETREDVENLIKFIQEVKFDHLGCFTYSPEEGTASYDFPNHIEESEKEIRKDLVMKAQQKICYQKNKLHIGETMEGLIYGKQGNDYLFRSYWNAPDDIDGKIYVECNEPLEMGTKVRVKITDSLVYDLVGELIEKI